MIIKKFEDFTSAELWALRLKVVVNSHYLADYENDYGISTVSLANFFEGYYDYINELAEEKYNECDHNLVMREFDNEDNLFSWFNCHEDFEWVKYDYTDKLNDLTQELVKDLDNAFSAKQIETALFAILGENKYSMNDLWNMSIYNLPYMCKLLHKYGEK